MAVLVPCAMEVRIVNDRIVIFADVDLKGLRKLARQIKAIDAMLTIEEDDETQPLSFRYLPKCGA